MKSNIGLCIQQPQHFIGEQIYGDFVNQQQCQPGVVFTITIFGDCVHQNHAGIQVLLLEHGMGSAVLINPTVLGQLMLTVAHDTL